MKDSNAQQTSIYKIIACITESLMCDLSTLLSVAFDFDDRVSRQETDRQTDLLSEYTINSPQLGILWRIYETSTKF